MLTARRAFWFLWSALLVLKLVVAARLPLFGDEAWYWLESRHPAWAYSDLPALTAWLIRFGTSIAGDTWFGVRWPFVLMGMLVPWLLMRFSARWFGAEAGWRAGCLALLLPLLGGLGFLALPDAPLTLAAMLCLAAAAGLRERIETRGVLLLGLGLVIGALSHYRFVLLIVAGACGLLADESGRRVLRDARVWAALAIGVVAWWPLLHWNLAHANAGLDFQLRERHPWTLHAGGFAFLLGQVIVVGPLLLALLVAALRYAWRAARSDRQRPWALIVATTMVPIAIYLALGFVADRERVSFHWLLQAYLPLLAVAPLVSGAWPRVLRALVPATTAMLLAGVFGFVLVAATPSWRAALADSRWYPDNFAGWDEIAAQLQAQPAAASPLADNFMLGAQLAFAFRDPRVAVLDHPLNHKHGRAAQLTLWNAIPTPSDLRRRPWSLVVEDSAVPLRERLMRYHRLCEQFGALPMPQVTNVDHGRKRFLRFELPGDPAADVDRMDGPPGSACVMPALAWIDAPAAGAILPRRFEVAGWAFKDGAGIARIEILLDGATAASADYGSPAPHVAAYWRISSDPAHPDVGFRAQIDAGASAPGTHWLGLRLHGRDGSVEDWPEQRVLFE